MSYSAHQISMRFKPLLSSFFSLYQDARILHNPPAGLLSFVSEDTCGKFHYVEKRKKYFTTKDLGLLVAFFKLTMLPQNFRGQKKFKINNSKFQTYINICYLIAYVGISL